jgi:hypothetical protein
VVRRKDARPCKRSIERFRRFAHVSSLSSVARVDYRYELRRDDESIATGRLSHELPFQVGDRIEIGHQQGIVRTIEPVLHEREMRLVVQLLTGPDLAAQTSSARRAS